MTATVREGDIVAQRYRVERMLGVGGMGVVMAATHIVLHERVAIKLLLPELAKNDEASKRFVREARAAARVKSEHIARVTDVGALDDGTPFMVMEYLEGETLAAMLEQRGRLSVGEAIDYVLQACRALAAAHDKGIVHRDLKPSNLFLARQDDGSQVLKVLDFGISKVNTPGSFNEGNITKTSAVMGSPNYMSPEQMRSTRTVDGRSDIWSLGVSLYELIAGDPPFVGQSFPEVCLAIAQDPPAPLRKHVPEVPAELDAAILRCLEKDPERRYSKVAELARALLPFLPPSAHSNTALRWNIADEASAPRLEASSTPSLAPPEASVSGSGRSPAVARTGSTWANTQQWQAAGLPPPRKGRTMALAAGLMGLGGAALGVWLTWRYTHTEVTPRPSPTPTESASVAKASETSTETPPPSAPSTGSAPSAFVSSPPTVEPAPTTDPPIIAPIPASASRPGPTGRPQPPPVRPPVRPPPPTTSKTGTAPNSTGKPPDPPPSSADPFGGRK